MRIGGGVKSGGSARLPLPAARDCVPDPRPTQPRLLAAKPTEFVEAEKLVLLWIHESERVYGDRLVSVPHLKQYRGLAAELAKKMFGKFSFQKYFQDKNPEPLVFAPFSKGTSWVRLV